MSLCVRPTYLVYDIYLVCYIPTYPFGDLFGSFTWINSKWMKTGSPAPENSAPVSHGVYTYLFCFWICFCIYFPYLFRENMKSKHCMISQQHATLRRATPRFATFFLIRALFYFCQSTYFFSILHNINPCVRYLAVCILASTIFRTTIVFLHNVNCSPPARRWFCPDSSHPP